ncbi:MAG: 50S ribosomal protein L9, partial [Gammaproteobacteria bacterium]
MEIILLETIDRLGALGDRVKVRAGFARNYLLPQGKAKLATADNIAEIEARRAELEKQEAEVLAAAKTRAEQLEGLEVSITAKSGGEGKLFGSITNANITEA